MQPNSKLLEGSPASRVPDDKVFRQPVFHRGAEQAVCEEVEPDRDDRNGAAVSLAAKQQKDEGGGREAFQLWNSDPGVVASELVRDWTRACNRKRPAQPAFQPPARGRQPAPVKGHHSHQQRQDRSEESGVGEQGQRFADGRDVCLEGGQPGCWPGRPSETVARAGEGRSDEGGGLA